MVPRISAVGPGISSFNIYIAIAYFIGEPGNALIVYDNFGKVS
jgi:hypothetical protein